MFNSYNFINYKVKEPKMKSKIQKPSLSLDINNLKVTMRIIYFIIFKHIKIVLAKPQATSVQHPCQYCDCHSILLSSWLRGTSARPLDPSGVA